MNLQAYIDDLRKYRNLVFVVFVFCMMATFSFLAMRDMQHSSAASTAGFNPGNIMSDAVMANYKSMTKDEIQRFLSSKGNCNNTNRKLYDQITAQYPKTTWHFENGKFVCLSEERFGDGVAFGADLAPGTGQTAAEIIYQAAQDYRINPQVLIVLLEKEQSLITDSYPNSVQYRSATGYGCPDTAACSTKYYGFKNQVRNAAKMFRSVLDGGWSNYPAGHVNYIQYNPTASCGGSNVYIENRATSALYRYTPYQPNASALAAGYGTGDGCGAYGNRNFYLYFSDWFGSTQKAIVGDSAAIPDGSYGLISKADPTKAITVANNSTDNNANIQIWDRTAAATKWNFRRDASGYYTISEPRSGKFLSVASATVGDGTNVVLSNQTDCRSKWRVYETPDHYLTFESACSTGIVLDDAGGWTHNGNNIQVWTTHTEDAVKWSIYTGQTLEAGVYTISSSNNSHKMIDNAGGVSRNANNVQIWDENHANAQKWRIAYDANRDAYSFVNPETGKRLDLAGAMTALGTNIQIWEPVEACSQYWKIVPVGNHYTMLSTCSPSRALDLAGGVTANMTNIHLWEVNNANAQKWQFHNQRLLPDGNYEIVSKADQNYAIDIVGGMNYDALNVNLYEVNHVPAAQLWHARYNPTTGDYTFLNQAGDRSLDLAGANPTIMTNIQIWSNNTACAQRWTLVQNDDKSYTFISTCQHDRALDLAGGSTFNANNIRLWSTNGADAQKWYFHQK